MPARMKSIVAAVLPLARAREAFEMGLKGHTRGKIVLQVQDEQLTGKGRPFDTLDVESRSANQLLPAEANMHSVIRDMPNQQEFTELLQPNLLPLNRFVFGMVGNQFDAEDIVQETVVKAFIHFADFRAESKFKTWLMSIAVNEVRTRRRTEFRSRMSYFDFDQLERLTERHLNRFALSGSIRKTRQAADGQNAMVSLHPAYKEMIRLRAVDG